MNRRGFLKNLCKGVLALAIPTVLVKATEIEDVTEQSILDRYGKGAWHKASTMDMDAGMYYAPYIPLMRDGSYLP